MGNEWLFWFTGVVFVLVGVLTAIYLVYMQLRRGATGHSILSTSDTLALVVIGVMFIFNRMNVASFNSDLKHYSETLAIKRQFGNGLNEECSYKKVLLGYALFLVPFLNAFVSMIAQTSECYFNIKSRASQEENSGSSTSTNEVNTKTINVKEVKDQLRGKSLDQLRVPTLISEMDLVVNKVSCVASDCVLDCQPSTSTGVKDPANIFLIPESKTTSEVGDKEFKSIITVPSTGDYERNEKDLGQLNMAVKSLRKFRGIKRLGLSLFGQWAIPLIATSVLLLSNMDEHSMDTLRRRDTREEICYVDNTLASGLKVSQKCLENAYQETYIQMLMGQHEKHDIKKLEMIRQYAANKNDTEIEYLTSAIINKIYGHVDEFNKTEKKEQYALKSSTFQIPITRKQRQASVSSFLKNLPKKNETAPQEIKPKPVAASNTRVKTKPSYKSDHLKRKNHLNQTRLENRESVDDGNLDDDGEATYYDELPVDYVQPTEANSAEDNDDKNQAGAASSEEHPAGDESKSEETEHNPAGESDTTRDDNPVTVNPATDKEHDDQPQSDPNGNENLTPPHNEHSNQATESVNQDPGVTSPVGTTKPTTEDIQEVTEEQIEEQIEDINANAATSLPNFVTVSTAPPGVSSLPSSSSGENIEPMKDVNVCVKSCFISNNFLKGYLFVLLFVGYFLPITVAVVMYIVTLKNINSIDMQSSSIKQDAVLDINGKEMCTSMECIAKIVKQFILINIVMWTPTFLESLLRTWFCVKSPEWVVLFLFFLGQAHGVIRNILNVKLVQTDSRGRVDGQSLWLGSHRKNDGTIHPTIPVPADSMSKSDQDKLFVKSRIVAKLLKLENK